MFLQLRITLDPSGCEFVYTAPAHDIKRTFFCDRPTETTSDWLPDVYVADNLLARVETAVVPVLSIDAESTSLPSLENAIDVSPLECPCKTRSSSPVSMSHIRMILSADDVARRELSGWKAVA